MDVRELHKLCIDSYTGTGGYLDGKYLHEFSKEEDYAERLLNSYYENYVIGMIASATQPVFGDKVQRKYDTPMYREFCNNVDMVGTPLTSWLLNVASYHTLLGNVFIIMDNVKEPIQNLQEAMAKRDYPFLYYKLPRDVQSVKLDRFGKVVSLSFALPDIEIEGTKYKQTRTVIDGVQIDTYKDGDETKQVGDTVTGVNIIMTGSEALPIPPFLSICQISKAIYNMDSEQRDLERAQAFNILQIPSDMPEVAQTLGSKNLLYVGSDATRDAKYISPDANILQTLGVSSDRMTVRLKDQARNLGIRVVEKHYKSGTALSLDYAPSYAVYANMSILFEDIEGKIRDMFSLATKTTDSTDITYNRDYAPSPDQLTADYELLVAAMDTDYGEDRNTKIIDSAYTKLSKITGLE